MLFVLLCSSVLFLIVDSSDSNQTLPQRFKRQTTFNQQPLCKHETTAVDQVYDAGTTNSTTRKKRFILFPEFINFLGNWKYIHRPAHFRYWITNFYPKRVNNEHVHVIIRDIIAQINTVLDYDITVEEAPDPGAANFHYYFFNYAKCPTDDPTEATMDNVQAFSYLSIYSEEMTRKYRYRAHGGIELRGDDPPISMIKMNMQQTFLSSTDLCYEPIIYTCVEATNECQIDLYYVLLHETLHGFGIEVMRRIKISIEENHRLSPPSAGMTVFEISSFTHGSELPPVTRRSILENISKSTQS